MKLEIIKTKHGYRTFITDKVKKIKVLGNVEKTKKQSIATAKEAFARYEI